MTQEQLAEKIGISSKSLSQIELGNNFVSAENLQQICAALNTHPKYLFDFDDINDSELLNYVTQKLKNNSVLLSKVCKIINIIE